MGEDIVHKYSSQLADLKMNSKPLINLLTMMAEDYIRHAPSIVQVIEKHLSLVRPELKLPVLYLIDSIIKNVKKEYVQLFTQNIVSTFCGVFEKVRRADEKTRLLLWKLRGTWTGHFPHKKLYAIDLRCHEIDQKWPIQAPPPATGSIHVNPLFLKANREVKPPAAALLNPEQILSHATEVTTATVSSSHVDSSASEVQMRAQLLAKQKELLELQTKKVELELLQTKLQIEEKARRQKEEEAKLDIAVKQEKMLLGMAETAKNRTEQIQQQLSNLHPKPSSGHSLKARSPSSKSQDSSSDRESHSSSSSKLAKNHGEASGSSVDGSPSKKSKSSRDKDKSDRDRRDRSRSEKSRDRHESKEKESRHRHRDKDRHSDSSKDKEKNRSRERSREKSVSKSGGDWKDYNEAKKVSQPKRSYRKETGIESDDEKMESIPEIKNLQRNPSPIHDTKSSAKQETGSSGEIDSHGLVQQSKSPPSSSQTGENSLSPGTSSPLKRKIHKDKQVDKLERSKDKESKNEKINKEKPVISDPRLRRRMEREKELKEVVEDSSNEHTSRNSSKPHELKDYGARRQAVLRKSYRKVPGSEAKDGDDTAKSLAVRSEPLPGDVDLRFEAPFDVDLRTETDGSGPEPPTKKSRPGSHGTFDDLFGHQDVDLRAGSSWTQVKLKEVDEGLPSQIGKNIIENELMGRDSKIMRSPGPPSPTNSVVSSTSSACDPLGRPLIYNRLPNDPEERKRSLDTRSTCIDAVEQFKCRHIDRALRGSGILQDDDMKIICLKAKEEHDQGLLNSDQYVAVMKQIVQIGEASAMKEVQQMQMSGNSWQMPSNTMGPNPWVTGTENNIWNSFPPAAAAGMGVEFPVRFPGANTPWDTTKSTPWMPAALPVAPAGPNPFEEAISRPQVDDFIPKANIKDLRMAEQDIGRTIPIDKVMRQIRFYRDSAIVMTGMNGDEPRDLTFQVDDHPRTILINGKPMQIYLGETKKFDLNRVSHSLRIGPPGRELCIDDKRYELFFGGRPKHVFIDGRSHSFQFLPPSPQVAVGEVPRYDLCAGKVTLTLDAITNVSVFLDEKLQKIDICGEPVVLRFCKGFKSVTLNGRAFPTNFGARLPFSLTLPNSEKHYLRFNSVSPETEHAMQIFINANYGGEWNDNRNNAHLGARGGRGAVVRGNMRGRGIGRGRRDTPMDIRAPGPNPWAPDTFPESPSNPNPLDIISSLFQTPSDGNKKKNASLDQSYESEQSVMEEDTRDSEAEKPAEAGGNVNVSDLVANLIKFGLLPSATTTTPESSTDEPAQEKVPEEEKEKKEEKKNPADKHKDSKVAELKPTTPPLPTVDVSFDDNLKERRDIVIGQISTGVQCSQCGLRFPPDQTLRYSQHLDWHFRQNRREKANARKALSRKWYYDLSDWIQFEEIEDLEERAASLFEHSDADADNESKSPATLNPEDFTVLASSHESAICPQCGETFESYFDEEREEWRLKNAKMDEYEGEEKLYHPICHQDYLRSLVEESVIEEDDIITDADGDNKENEVNVATPPTPTPTSEDDDEVLIIKEGKKEIVVMEVDIEDDDVEKIDSSVNVVVNEDKSSNNVNIGSKTDDVSDKGNCNAEKDCISITNDDSSLDNNATRSSLVQSPILIDEDSTFLPGLCDDAEGGVFGFALGSGSQKEKSTDQSGVEDKRIIYEPMKFDIPPIKLEPPDEEPVQEDTEIVSNDFMSNLQPFLASSGDRSPGGSEPMNIDLTEEDSTDAVDSGARLVTQIRTSIDGNLQHEDATAIPFMPAAKIRINLSGIGNLSVPSDTQKEKAGSPQANHAGESESTVSQDQALVKDDGSSNIFVSNNSEINKNNPVDPVLTEEMKRLKPRLVGIKLKNIPPKTTGTEESGLCVIC